MLGGERRKLSTTHERDARSTQHLKFDKNRKVLYNERVNSSSHDELNSK